MPDKHSEAPRLDELFSAMREDCGANVWSQGVKLARADAVSLDRAGEHEVVLRVREPSRTIAPTVILYSDDEDWECDCKSSNTCAHAVAAIIAFRQALKSGKPLATPGSKAPGNGAVIPTQALDSALHAARMKYRFVSQDIGLELRRQIPTGAGKETLLRTPLLSLVADRSSKLAFEPTQQDLLVDRIVGPPNTKALPQLKLANVFTALAGAPEVYLDDVAVQISGEPWLPEVLVETRKDGVRVTFQAGAEPTELAAYGVVRCGGELRQIGDVKLCGARLDKLPLVQDYPKAQLAELAVDVLPDLEARFEVQVKTRRLPAVNRWLKPRLVMEVQHQGQSMKVMPLLVYGDPPQVRIDNGHMVYLGGEVPQRDLERERALLDQLRDDLNMVTGRWVSYDGRDVAVFSKRLQEWSDESLDSSQRPFHQAAPLQARLNAELERFELSFEVELADDDGVVTGGDGPQIRRADAASVLSAWRDGLDLAPLEGGGWAPLPMAWLDLHGDRLADLLAARDDEKRLSKVVLPTLVQLCDDLELPRPPEFESLRPLLEGFEHVPEASLPADLRAELRPYQRRGVDWLMFLKQAGLGAILADDMGLGKTLQALCAVHGRTLVVCPTSVVHNWADEICKFRPGLSFSIYHGPKRQLADGPGVTLTSYPLLRIDADLLAREHWDSVILDESQNIKNPDSQVARAAYRLKADFFLSMSGTPVENRLDELWSQFHFCNRGLLGGRKDFQERYVQAVDSGDANATQRLRQRIRPFVLRRLKRDVAPELPPRTDVVMHCELEDNERLIYDTVRAATQKEVVAKLKAGGSVLLALEALLRLRQACCHPSLVPGQEAATSAKLERLLNALENAVANGHKALVFSQWTSFLDLVEPHLDAAQLAYTRLDGSTRDRAAVVEKFQSDDGPPVLLISLKAGGTGLNLTAADHVFLLDPWWNPAVEDQAADRTHRIGQDKPVMVYRLVAKDTVEERILALQEKKRAIVDAALGEAEQARGLTREDLLALLA